MRTGVPHFSFVHLSRKEIGNGLKKRKEEENIRVRVRLAFILSIAFGFLALDCLLLFSLCL